LWLSSLSHGPCAATLVACGNLRRNARRRGYGARAGQYLRMAPEANPVRYFLKQALLPWPGWRNWQTQRTQNPPALAVMGVRPPLPAPNKSMSCETQASSDAFFYAQTMTKLALLDFYKLLLFSLLCRVRQPPIFMMTLSAMPACRRLRAAVRRKSWKSRPGIRWPGIRSLFSSARCSQPKQRKHTNYLRSAPNSVPKKPRGLVEDILGWPESSRGPAGVKTALRAPRSAVKEP
jgi:hypothetical protein